LFSSRTPVITVNEFNFDVGRDRVFAHANGSIAAVGSLGIQVLSPDGRETLRDSFRTSRPAIIEAGGVFLAFDIGGSAIRVFNASQILSSIETEGSIVSASINNSSWFCVVTQEQTGFKSEVMVYNSIGLMVYRVSLWSGYVLTAHLSPDNKSLAILNLTDTGSRITFYHGIDSDKNPDYLYELADGLIIDMKYLSNTEILAISTDSLFLVDRSGNSKTVYTYPDKRLGGYILNDSFGALHLYDYNIGFSGQLVTVSFDGTILGEVVLEREIISMSSANNSLIIFRSDGLTFFDEKLEEFPVYGEHLSASAATRVLAISDDLALATSDHSAIIVERNPNLREEER